MLNISKLKNQDPISIFLVVIISIIGLVNVFTTTFFPERTVSQDFKDQVLFFIVGILFYLIICCLDTSLFSQLKLQAILFVITISLLTAVLFLANPELGPRRWLSIGSFSFQPSEFAKLFIVTFTASIFVHIKKVKIITPINIYESIKRHQFANLLSQPLLPKIIVNSIVVGIIVFLIQQQPSLGNAMITLMLWGLMLLSLAPNPFKLSAYFLIFGWGINAALGIFNLNLLYEAMGITFTINGIDLFLIAISLGIIFLLMRFLRFNVYLSLIALAVGLILGVSANFIWNEGLADYQKDRIINFINPSNNPLGAQWQVNQSKIAIGAGQVLGRGLLQGTQTNLKLLPYAYTDFAYAALVEQSGLRGAFILLLSYLLLILRIIQIGNTSEGNFERLICVGVSAMLLLNIFINIGMNLGIMPVTGVPLPWVSYGGSAVLVNFIALGLVQMVYAERREMYNIKVERLANILN